MEKIEIKMLQAVKTKTGKCILNYTSGDVESDYLKGKNMLQCWFDDLKLFDNWKKELADVPVVAEGEYVRVYGNNARFQLKAIYDKNGRNILV